MFYNCFEHIVLYYTYRDSVGWGTVRENLCPFPFCAAIALLSKRFIEIDKIAAFSLLRYDWFPLGLKRGIVDVYLVFNKLHYFMWLHTQCLCYFK